MKQPSPIFHGVVSNGQIVVHNQDGFAWLVKKLEGKSIEIVLRKYIQRRTSPQNRYMWGVVYPILCEHFGWDSCEEMHDAMKDKFLTDRSGPIPKVGSTAKLNREDFGDYLDRIILWAATEHQCIIPPAREVEAA